MVDIIEILDGVPVASDQGNIAFCSVTMLEGPDREGNTRRILIDSAHVGRRPQLVDSLAKRGLTTQDIDYVVATHAHWDHMQNNDLFTDATVLMHADERRYAHNPAVDDWATPSWTGYLVEQLKLQEVGEGHEIIPGVTIMDMPGHSVGTIGVSVETPEGLAVMTSDAIHLGSVAQSGINPLIFWDEKQSEQSINRIKKRADIIYPGHDAPFRVLADGGIEYLREPQMAVAGITPTVIDVGDALPNVMMPGRHDEQNQNLWRETAAQRIADVVPRKYLDGAAPVPQSEWDHQ
ncbi:MAG TPA: MBL fold metallo-hydrolase [Candidatus Corynebacterium avicola]|uniref:MBL fold metallo-hydrolase n=1 Tax=Candidatus Corynebacterium avicola TaxID=2838527 RepID=A0A9D1ULW9_9CORY|nr:MBL fold metallo-hydrolase [Candidatus Corynebacterium avicola]